MKSNNAVLLIFLVVFAALFGWVQDKILAERTGKRVEEKILMLSNRPEVTRVVSLGFDGAVADMLWIRAIQYFGGNFSTLNVEEKKQGMMNLLDNLVGLDPHFVTAYQFGGFIINESIKDHQAAISFLIDGSEHNPEAWRLPFDAGFTAFYELKDYETAKALFQRAIYGPPYSGVKVTAASGLVEPANTEALVDINPDEAVTFSTESGSFTLDIGAGNPVGKITVEKNSTDQQSYRLEYSSSLSDDKYIEKETATFSGVSVHTFEPAPSTHFLKFDQFQSKAEDGTFTVNEVTVYGARNPETPQYVDRMAIEMDRSSGRFLAAWEQFQRNYVEAVQKGDEVSAGLVEQKMEDIYSAKCLELVEEAVVKYKEANGKLPSTQMQELVDEGFLEQVIREKIAEDPSIQQEILPVLLSKTGTLQDLLSNRDATQPHLLLPHVNEEGEETWQLASRTVLLADQKNVLTALQQNVERYHAEKGSYPSSLEELSQAEWFPQSSELLKDPLGGELVIEPNTGQVRAINPKY